MEQLVILSVKSVLFSSGGQPLWILQIIPEGDGHYFVHRRFVMVN